MAERRYFFPVAQAAALGNLAPEEPHETGPNKETRRARPHQLGIATRPAPEPNGRQDRTSHNRASVQPALQVSGKIAADW